MRAGECSPPRSARSTGGCADSPRRAGGMRCHQHPLLHSHAPSPRTTEIRDESHDVADGSLPGLLLAIVRLVPFSPVVALVDVCRTAFIVATARAAFVRASSGDVVVVSAWI